MSKRLPSILTAFFLPVLAGALLLLVVGLGFAAGLPERASEKFGPPAAGLGLITRYRLAAQLLLQEGDLTQPADPNGTEMPFEVSLGESVPSVTQRLVQAGLIRNPGAFRAFLQYAGLDVNLQAGDYELSPAMTAVEIGLRMQDATPGILKFTILAGWRIEEIAAALPTSGLEISSKAFIAAAQVRSPELPLSNELPDRATLEGFLFPGVYEVPREITAPDLIQMMVTKFDSEVSNELRQAYANQGLSLFEAVSLASIVQREAVVEEEMALIASVFMNRLAVGMQLGADPTVQYALGYNDQQDTWWTNPLSAADLQIDSLYNTYIYAGIPPGPIANPNLAALRATAFPAQTPYYYFRAVCDGSGWHNFAETFDEHVSNACP
jgi:UPF0755 protein